MTTYTKHTIGNASITKHTLLLNSGRSQNYNSRGISYIFFEHGKNYRCEGSFPIWRYYYNQVTKIDISYSIGYSSKPIWVNYVPGPSKSMFFNSLNYTLYHDDDNPLIANCIPHPSSYGTIMPYDENDIIYDWYSYFRSNRQTYLLLDKLDNIYYEILWDVNSQTYTIKKNNNVTNYKLIDEIFMHSSATGVFKKVILYGGSLNLVDIEDQTKVHNQTVFIVNSIDYTTNQYSKFYRLELDSTVDGGILFITSNSCVDMFDTDPKFITNDVISVNPDLYLLESYSSGKKHTKCLAYIGFNETRLIQPAFKITNSVVINNFAIQESINKSISLEDRRIYFKLYDQDYNQLYSRPIVEINDISIDFEKYWLEISDVYFAFSDISYLNSAHNSSIDRFNIDSNVTTLYMTFDIDFDGLDHNIPDMFEGFRGITFNMEQESNANVDKDKMVGFFEFRKPLILNNILSVGQNMHGINIGNRVDYSDTTNWDKYGAGVAGFKRYNDNTKTYIYTLFFTDDAPDELVENSSVIISGADIDVKIHKLLNQNKQYINVIKYSTELVNQYKYENLGEVSLLTYNLPVKFDGIDSVSYSNMEYNKNINYWIIRGIHSNLDSVRTYFSLPANPSRHAVYTVYRIDELSKVVGDVESMERYPSSSFTGVTRNGQFNPRSDSYFYCSGERHRTFSYEASDVKWNYLLSDNTIHTIPFDTNHTACGYLCGRYYNGYYDEYSEYAYYFKNYFNSYLYKHEGIYEYQINTGVNDIAVRDAQQTNFYAETLKDSIIPHKYKIYALYNKIDTWGEEELQQNASLEQNSILYEDTFNPNNVLLGNTIFFYIYLNLNQLIKKENIQLGLQVVNDYVDFLTDRTNMDIHKFFMTGMTISYIKIKELNISVVYDKFNDILYDLEWNILTGSDRDKYLSIVEYRYKMSMDVMEALFFKIDNNGNCNFNSDAITDVIEFYEYNTTNPQVRINTSVIDKNKCKWFNPVYNNIRTVPILYEK